MNQDELSKLTPEEKRVRCATLMGWKTTNRPSGIMVMPELYPGRVDYSFPPEYEQNADAALTLCDRMAEEGWLSEIINRRAGGWECRFWAARAEIGNMPECKAEAATLHEAIVNAFLLAKG